MLSRGFVVLWISMFVAISGIGMVSPLLPIYVREDLGGPAVAVALSFSGVAVAQMFGSPFVGRLGDRYGVKRFLVGGFLVYCLAGFGYLLAGRWETVIALRIFSGLGVSLIFPMSLAYVGRLAPPGREGEFMGAFAVSQILGFGIGPLMGGALRDAFGSDTAFTAMALLLGATGLFVFLLLPPKPRPRGAPDDYVAPEEPRLSWGELLRRRYVQAAMTVTLVTSLGFAASGAFLAVYIVSDDGLGTGSATFVGILLGSRALMGAWLQPLFGRLADRVNRITMVMIGLIGSASAQFLIPIVPSDTIDVAVFSGAITIVPWLVVVYLMVGTAEAMVMPAQSAIFVTVGRAVGMGSIMGVNQMSGSVGFLGGSLLGAAVVATFGVASVFRYSAIMTVIGALLFFTLMRRAADEIRDAERLGRELSAIHPGD